MRAISQNGLESIKESEGIRLEVYNDSAGYPTIGIGHLLTTNEKAVGIVKIGTDFADYSRGITEKEAFELLSQDVRYAVDAVNRLVKVGITQCQFDALVSLAFNIGTGAFGNSTLLRRLNTGEYSSVPFEMRRWRKAGGKVSQGLVNRREVEIKLWLGDGCEERRRGELNLINDNGDEVTLKGNWSIK